MKRKLLVVGSIIGALLLSGCASANSAANIGKTEITLNTVQSSINDILKERTKYNTANSNLPSGQSLNVNVLRFHVVSAIFDYLADGAKLKITDGDLAKKKAEIIAQIGSADQLPGALVNASLASKDLNRYLRTVVIADRLSAIVRASGDTSTDGSGVQKLIIAAAKHEGVTINPRYGTWNYTTGNIDAAAPNSALK